MNLPVGVGNFEFPVLGPGCRFALFGRPAEEGMHEQSQGARVSEEGAFALIAPFLAVSVVARPHKCGSPN